MPKSTWDLSGPLILFLGLLSLLNAPFDWVSLGVTRVLLRRGLELGAWWPYILALLDAVVAAVTITVLTIVSVLSIQLFDDLAVHWRGEQALILPLQPLLHGIETNPSSPEFWWVYAMLLSTMIPSLINLAIAGMSLLRGVPWITKLLVHFMPEKSPPRPFDRPWITLLLTGQVFVGAAIGIVLQCVLAYVAIWRIIPLAGWDLLDIAREIAAADLPGQAIAAVLGNS